MAAMPLKMDIPRSIAQLKSLFFRCLCDNTHLMTELPLMHGEKWSDGANYETSPAVPEFRRSQIQLRSTTMTRRIANLTNLILSLSLAMGLLCAGAHASAQSVQSFTIPFAFSANHNSVSAGSYQVQLLSDHFLSLRNIKANKTQILLVRPEVGQVIETKGRLIFRRDGGRNYLTQVWIAGTNVHSELAVRLKPERAFAKRVALQDSSFEVAQR